MSRPVTIPRYTQGKSSLDDARMAVAAASDFWLSQSNQWTMNLLENTQHIFIAPAFNAQEVVDFQDQYVFPMRFEILQTDRTIIKTMLALEGLMMACLVNPKQHPNFIVSAQALVRTMLEKMEAIDTRVLGQKDLDEDHRAAYEHKCVGRAVMISLIQGHINNIRAVCSDAVSGRIQMPMALDPIITSKLASTSFISQDPPGPS